MIDNVELVNWKTFANLQLPLSKGITFIAGPNGIGKSSILQAICVAFTGQVPDGIELRDCIRRGAESTSIQLDFRKGNDVFSIRRSLTLRARDKCSVASNGKKVFQGNWDETTDYIENSLKIQPFIFNKLVFMSEGDVYRSIREPPGKQLLNEIDRLLGITQLQSLENEVRIARKEFRDEIIQQQHFMERAEMRPRIEGDLEVSRYKLSTLQESKGKMAENREMLESELRNKQDKIRETEVLHNDLLCLEKEKAELSVERAKTVSLQKECHRIQDEIETLNNDEIVARTEISNFEKILEVVNEAQRVEGSSINCPVCKKPISKHEIEEIRKELSTQKESKQSMRLNIIKRLEVLNTERRILESQTNESREKELRLKILEEKYVAQTLTSNEAGKVLDRLKAEAKSLESKLRELYASLSADETQIGNLRETIGRIESAKEYKGSEKSEIAENLKTGYVGEYLADFSLSGIEELLSEQRDSRLREKLYTSISEVWGNFKGEGGWSVTLDEEALPSLRQESLRYPFHLLSAGEKTALLVVTRTMLSALFIRNVGFLLLDEPLEHLDQRNRHSLLQFLVDAQKEEIVSQLIVTTTEASLLRKFVDYKNVNIVSL